jgi:eukaryotic-like serine/threonine-protein kinase
MLPRFKQGLLSPTCKNCNRTFQLRIKPQAEGKFSAETIVSKDQDLTREKFVPESNKLVDPPAAAHLAIEENDAELLKRSATRFNSVPMARLRELFFLALVSLSFLIATVIFFLSWRMAISILMLPVFTGLAYFAITGFREGRPLFTKARELVFLSGPLSWLKWSAAGFIFLLALYLAGLFFLWLFVAIVGIGLAIGYHFAFDQGIAKARQESLEEIEKLLRRMRIQGAEEPVLQDFVAKFSGRDWEELFEQLFGYSSKRNMRDEISRSELGQTRPIFWGWRDPIYDRWDARVRLLQGKAEPQPLETDENTVVPVEGLATSGSAEVPSQVADTPLEPAAELKIAALEKRIAELDPAVRQEQKRERFKQLLAEARRENYQKPKTKLEQLEPILNRFAGGYVRLLMGCLLVLGSILWARQNNILQALQTSAVVISQAANHTNEETPSSNQAIQDAVRNELTPLKETLHQETEPLRIPILGRLLFSDFNALIAGMILMASALVFGWRMSLYAIPAALVAIFGSAVISSDIENVPTLHSLSALIALGIFMLGTIFGREED